MQQRRDELQSLTKLRARTHTQRLQNARSRKDVQAELSRLVTAHRANAKQAQAEARRREQLEQRAQLAALHNRSAEVARDERTLEGQVRSNLTALNSDMRVERAERRRLARLERKAQAAAERNRDSQNRAQGRARLNEARTVNAILKQQGAQTAADIRRRELQLLKQTSVALHNERVELLKTYMKMSDYVEDVDAEEVEEEDDDDHAGGGDGGGRDVDDDDSDGLDALDVTNNGVNGGHFRDDHDDDDDDNDDDGESTERRNGNGRRSGGVGGGGSRFVAADGLSAWVEDTDDEVDNDVLRAGASRQHHATLQATLPPTQETEDDDEKEGEDADSGGDDGELAHMGRQMILFAYTKTFRSSWAEAQQ